MTRAAETVATLVGNAERRLTSHQRVIEWATFALGRPSAVYAVTGFAVGWMVLNGALLLLGHRAPDPPPFSGLAGVASVAAVILTGMVLTTQNRLAKNAEKRAQLDLQINLLAEQKATKLIALVEELRRDLPNVRNRRDPVAEAMKEQADAQQVLEIFERALDSDDERKPKSEVAAEPQGSGNAMR